MTALLIVTPMHNEEANVLALHSSLASQTYTDFRWVVVDDESTDQTASVLNGLNSTPNPRILSHRNDGGLIGGSAYTAWDFGVGATIEDSTRYIMKLDADVHLEPGYLAAVIRNFTEDVGVVGGVLVGGSNREQAIHVPGPIKVYSMRAWNVLSSLPRAIGFDVMDEVALSTAGLRTVVLSSERVSLRRPIGASEGGIHGRWRNGRVCRWTGYFLPYFALHVLRYVFRRPYLIGALAMTSGYVQAGTSPYSRRLRNAHAASQRAKLGALLRHPVRWIRQTYFY